MTQEKMRRVITACVSAATVLLVFFLGFLIYQWISIGILNDKIKDAKAEVTYWKQQLQEADTDKEYLLSDHYLQAAIQKLEHLQGK